MNLIWQRYLLKAFLKVFVLVLFSFYFLYVLIDFSIHSKVLSIKALSFDQFLLYYIYQFTKRCDLLVAFALLIATIKVLTTLNQKSELVALAASGISLKKIVAPLLMLGILSYFLMILNYEFVQPRSLNYIEHFEETFFKTGSKKKGSLHSFLFDDHTALVYQKFDTELQAFIDVFWIKNSDTLFKIGTLYVNQDKPYGKHVEAIERNSLGELKKRASYAIKPFSEMKIPKHALEDAAIPLEQRSLRELSHQFSWKNRHLGMSKMNDHEANLSALFYYKLLTPLGCILAVLGPLSFCVRFSRYLPIFFIYGLSLFGLMTYFTFMNSALILGQHQVISPFWALLLPPMIFFLLSGPNYVKL